MTERRIKSVAIIGAGAAGAVTAAAFVAEGYFKRVQVYERRESAGGTWIYDPVPPSQLPLRPGLLPPDTDPRLIIPNDLPKTTAPISQERFSRTPIYDNLTTNVPAIAMSFSDIPFDYGPFVPHYIPRQYVESYFSKHKLDSPINLSLNTTVEDLSLISKTVDKDEHWKLVLRKHDPLQQLDNWWEEEFDAVVLANGHYSVPFIPEVKGLAAYIKAFPKKIIHSKVYRNPEVWRNKKVLVIGNSASGHDITHDLLTTAKLPVLQSRHSKSRWEGPKPPDGIEWKPIITEFRADGRIIFEDGTSLKADELDTVIYSTGYRPSYPFWNSEANGQEIWDYEKNKLHNSYLHTFFYDFPTLAIIGAPRTLTFRSFEYQAIALARLWSNRNSQELPSIEEQKKWEKEREGETRKKFHDIEWESGETLAWLEKMYRIAGLGDLKGAGRNPPRLGEDVIWSIEHLRKYPEPDRDASEWAVDEGRLGTENEWVVVDRTVEKRKDLLHFI